MYVVTFGAGKPFRDRVTVLRAARLKQRKQVSSSCKRSKEIAPFLLEAFNQAEASDCLGNAVFTYRMATAELESAACRVVDQP